MEFVFFSCKDLDKQDPVLIDIFTRGTNVYDERPRYEGIGQNDEKRRLDPDNIVVTDGIPVLKNIDNPLDPWRWRRYKEGKGIRRDTPQTEAVLHAIGFLPSPQ